MIPWLSSKWYIIALPIASWIIYLIWRYRRSMYWQKNLAAELEKRGLSALSVEEPGCFQTGPFPKIEIKVSGIQTNVFGMRGEYTDYKIVRFRTPDGKSCEAWAKLEFEAFRLKRIEWKPGLEEFNGSK